MLPKIGIVILNWNGWRDTLDCLTCIRGLNYPAELIEVVIVDNGSNDESVAQLRQQPDVTLLELPSNVGFAAGNNAGIRHVLAKGCDYVLVLNNDTLVSLDFLMPLVQVFSRDPIAGLVSPKIRYKDTPERLWFAGGKFREPRLIGEMTGCGELDQGQYNQARVVDYAVGCCMLIKRAVFEQIGYLDERFFFYHEDVDFSYRATSAGFSVWYQPESAIMHKVSESTKGDLPRRAFLEAQSRVVFFAKHVSGTQLCAVIGWEVLRLIRVLGESLWQGRLDVAWGYMQGLFAGLRGYLPELLSKKGSDPSVLATRDGSRPKVILWLAFSTAVFIYLGLNAYHGVRQLVATGVEFATFFLLLSFACQFVGVLLATAVWGDILQRLGVKSGYWFDLRTFCVSALARKLPGTVWYAVSRLTLYKQTTQPVSRVLLALVIETIVIALGGLVAIGIGISAGFSPGINQVAYLFFVLPTAIVSVSWIGPTAIRFALARIGTDPLMQNRNRQHVPVDSWDVLRWLLGEASVIALGAGVAFFIIKSISQSAPVSYASVLGAWGVAVALGPIAMWLPSDIGIKDGFMYLVLDPLVGGPLAAVMTLAWRFWVSLLEIVFGVVCGVSLGNTIGQLRNEERARHD